MRTATTHARRQGRRWRTLLLAAMGFVLTSSVVAGDNTRLHQIAAGVRYQPITIDWSPIRSAATGHLFEIDPSIARIKVVRPEQGKRATVAHLRQQSGAQIVLNASFFGEDGRALGLVVQEKKVVGRAKRTSWGTFVMRGHKPSLEEGVAGVTSKPADYVVQGMPRLVVNGKPNSLKEQVAARSVVCLRQDRVVLLVISDIEANKLARALATPIAKGGFGCENALNLDGGPSTQLSAKMHLFAIEQEGGWPVPNGIAVFADSSK